MHKLFNLGMFVDPIITFPTWQSVPLGLCKLCESNCSLAENVSPLLNYDVLPLSLN